MPATHSERRWAALVDAQEASGLTVRAFAEANGINPHSLTWWRGRLRRHKASTVGVAFTEIAVVNAPSLVLEIGRARLLVDARTDLQLLRSVVEALC